MDFLGTKAEPLLQQIQRVDDCARGLKAWQSQIQEKIHYDEMAYLLRLANSYTNREDFLPQLEARTENSLPWIIQSTPHREISTPRAVLELSNGQLAGRYLDSVYLDEQGHPRVNLQALAYLLRRLNSLAGAVQEYNESSLARQGQITIDLQVEFPLATELSLDPITWHHFDLSLEDLRQGNISYVRQMHDYVTKIRNN